MSPGARATLAKYVALQIPGAAMVAAGLAGAVWLFDLSPLVAGGLLGLWILKDAALYPIVRVAYEPGEPDPSKDLIGAVGTARLRIDPEGWVRIGSELWRVELRRGAPPIEDGAQARVVGVRGLTLEVEPDL